MSKGYIRIWYLPNDLSWFVERKCNLCEKVFEEKVTNEMGARIIRAEIERTRGVWFCEECEKVTTPDVVQS